MARALYGFVGTTGTHRTLELQVSRLRARVRELEAELAEVRAEAAARDAVDRHTLDRQLAELTEPLAEPMAESLAGVERVEQPALA
jgi:hypothetical protein